MKRILSFLVISVFFSSIAFAAFPNRYFEIKVNAPLDVTNNLCSLNDLLQKEIKIDLGKIADELPKEGFSTILATDPNVGIGFNILGVHAGITAGVDIFGKTTLSKDYFNFLGNGNVSESEDGFSIKELNFGGSSFESDVFIHNDIDASFKIGDFKIGVTASVFMPVIHVKTESAKTTVINDEDGNLSIVMDTEAKVYSFIEDFNNPFANIPFSSMGYDLGCSVAFPIREDLVLEGFVHTPVVPGHLNYVSDFGYKWSANTSLKELASGDYDFDDPEKTSSTFESTDYLINRPFRFAVRANYTPFGKFLVFNGNLGFGIRNPFSKGEEKFFMEYLFGATITAKDIVYATLSTEYTDELFKHSFSTGFNLRVLELDIGASLASPTFVQSFKGTGISGFLTLCFGF